MPSRSPARCGPRSWRSSLPTCTPHPVLPEIRPFMKIVHIITRLIIGGAQENTLLSCQGQHDLGHDVTLITGPALGPEGSLMERAKTYGYKVIVLDEMRRAIHPIRDFRVYRH